MADKGNIYTLCKTEETGTCLPAINQVITILIRMYLNNHSGLCGLVVRVLGYRSGGPSSIPGTTRKKSSGSGTGPFSLVSTTEELLDRKSSSFCLENREYGHRDVMLTTWHPLSAKIWQSLRRQAAVARSV
jgi:hypothetical protein